jgi:uncharacterized membrane protein
VDQTNGKLAGQTNHVLRQVNANKAEALISKIQAIVMPAAGEGVEPVTMPDAVAAISAVLTVIIMQAEPKYRMVLTAVIGNLIAHNLHGATLNEAIDKAAEEATKAERGTANALPI